MDIAQVIDQALVTTHFQPIARLDDAEILGFEALSRGPAQSVLATPRALFHAAERCGDLLRLEQTCWRSALASAAEQVDRRSASARLFLNVLPDTLSRAVFRDAFQALLAEFRVDAASIVIEVSEATRIDDFAAFRAVVAGYRSEGCGIAIDDAGAGHAGLQTIAEIVPDYIKIDGDLIRDVDKHRARRATVQALLVLARNLGVDVIAEGIEREGELAALRDLGVRLGQGFLIGRPEPAMQPPAGREQIRSIARHGKLTPTEARRVASVDAGSIGQYVTHCAWVERGSPLQAAVELFEGGHGDGVAVVDRGRPVGLLMKAHVFQMLGRAFGRELYLRKPVELVAHALPLIVASDASLEDVSRLAMARPAVNVYDQIIVTKAGTMFGAVSVQSLLAALTDSRLAAARHANPLTGLPGNAVIEAEIRARLASRSTIAVMHLDLDDFKAFNDRYGFHRGDLAITMTADIIGAQVSASGDTSGFLGHIGGDDFLAIVDSELAPPLAARIAREFEKRVISLYDPDDRDAGWIPASNRDGEPVLLPLMTLSWAMAVVEPADSRHYAELIDDLTSAKRDAKLRKRDRRNALTRAAVA